MVAETTDKPFLVGDLINYLQGLDQDKPVLLSTNLALVTLKEENVKYYTWGLVIG